MKSLILIIILVFSNIEGTNNPVNGSIISNVTKFLKEVTPQKLNISIKSKKMFINQKKACKIINSNRKTFFSGNNNNTSFLMLNFNINGQAVEFVFDNEGSLLHYQNNTDIIILREKAFKDSIVLLHSFIKSIRGLTTEVLIPKSNLLLQIFKEKKTKELNFYNLPFKKGSSFLKVVKYDSTNLCDSISFSQVVVNNINYKVHNEKKYANKILIKEQHYFYDFSHIYYRDSLERVFVNNYSEYDIHGKLLVQGNYAMTTDILILGKQIGTWKYFRNEKEIEVHFW